MSEIINADLCVIGGGSGGLSVAAGASQMGADVVLIEKGKMGGDCLNYGCVPSKSIIAAGHAADVIRRSGRFGVNGTEPAVDFLKVREHIRSVIAGIAPHDSVERFEGLGVKVLQEAAVFSGPREAKAGDSIVRAKRFVVCTGSSAAVPPIDGIQDVPFLTNETVFELDERPEHLIVIGGGPIGAELAQAHRRLGAKVTLLEMFRVLGKDDPEVTEFARRRLVEDGVAIREGIKIVSVGGGGNQISVEIEADGQTETITGSHLLVAAGRRANVDGLNLEAAGVSYSPRGIEVDARLRTSNKRIFALGDVAGGLQFTHVAGYHAGIVIRNALFRLPAKACHDFVPWVTFTDPEIAHVGLTEAQAKEKFGDDVKVLRWSFEENDRARAERETEGLVKIVVGKRGKILGASIGGPRAGELLQPWVLALSQKLKIGAMANAIAPYPTLSEVSKRVAGSYYTDALFGERTRKIVRFLQKFG
ncbi:NAD(P)/FAD-dependent oxidoreductase [Pelagibius sp. Alg239-R121]|uniref:dihydrolipoyl dehydrogenase family protein n=1 Tax=Pelagibius sp. Alg239-R121 TaxID=2993448 RepID=UPI0024A6ED03|nr:FAD-dependent oxidoreductase [Pelagibius sp. Alg239-R121]